MIKVKNRVGEIGYNNQGEKIIIIRYGGAKDIDVQFEDGIIVYNRSYSNFIKGKVKHPIRYEESFAYHIEVELGIDLDDIWNWDKNNELGINPYEITKQSNKKVWLYCLEHDYHNYDREGNRIGYQIACNHFYNNRRCSYCHKGISEIHWKDSLAYNYPQIAEMIAIKENNLTFDDCYKIACTSGNYYCKCLDCGSITDKKIRLGNIIFQGFSCKICSDGISISEKFMANILKQLDEDFITQLNKSDFKWCENFRYDFYLPKYNMIIETHGEQHYIENTTNNWKTLEQEQMNDLFKYKCAKSHIDKYIVIDCRYSKLEWLKENITKELGNYFNLSNINWEKAWEKSQKSKCIETWELYDNKYSIKDIAIELNLCETCVRNYIKRRVE